MCIAVFLPYQIFLNAGVWFANNSNPLVRYPGNVIYGDIVDANDILLAGTYNNSRSYIADEASRLSMAHVIGDANHTISGGVETTLSGYLLGFRTNAFKRLVQSFSGSPRQGDSIKLSLDIALNRCAASLFPKGKKGAIVILDYTTGEIRAMTDTPTFDLTHSASGLSVDAVVNRVTERLLPPGSVMKTVVYAAALQYLPHIEEETWTCIGNLPVESGTIVEAGGAAHGVVTLEQAYTVSCNVCFANLAMQLGWDKLIATAKQFGIGDELLTTDIRMATGGLIWLNKEDADKGRDEAFYRTLDGLAQTGIGQAKMLTTPMEMALIAAAIANGGVMMEPRLLTYVKEVGGGAVPIASTVLKRAVSAEVAAKLKAAMISAVADGTGKNAKVAGVTVGGKTGSAEWGEKPKENLTHSWFTGFIDDAAHPLAICVVVEEGGSGGDSAAVIARNALTEALRLGY